MFGHVGKEELGPRRGIEPRSPSYKDGASPQCLHGEGVMLRAGLDTSLRSSPQMGVLTLHSNAIAALPCVTWAIPSSPPTAKGF